MLTTLIFVLCDLFGVIALAALAAPLLPWDPEAVDLLARLLHGGSVSLRAVAVIIAMILALGMSDLDLVLQLQILDLLAGLRERLGTAFLFITHDVRLVRRFCDRVAVPHDGRLVEDRPVAAPFTFDHPAARALLNAMLPAAPSPALRHRSEEPPVAP